MDSRPPQRPAGGGCRIRMIFTNRPSAVATRRSRNGGPTIPFTC